MCGILGYLNLTPTKDPSRGLINDFLLKSFDNILPRGPDAFGVAIVDSRGVCVKKEDIINGNYDGKYSSKIKETFETYIEDRGINLATHCILVNARGIPTTEVSTAYTRPRKYTLNPEEIQPFTNIPTVKSSFVDSPDIIVVTHNGIIANDKVISKGVRYMSSVNHVSHPYDIDSYALMTPLSENQGNSSEYLNDIEGSFALATLTKNKLTLSRNYLGLFLAIVEDCNKCKHLFWSSEPFGENNEGYLDILSNGESRSSVFMELPTNSYLEFPRGFINFSGISVYEIASLLKKKVVPLGLPRDLDKVAVVLSGGLDSTIVATLQCSKFKEVHLLHFQYGCHAEKRELEAVELINKYLVDRFPRTKIILKIVDMLWMKDLGGSSLTDTTTDTIVNGDRGAELATEWVPARNLCMASIAAAYCDANAIGTISLGLNREESSAFKDNSTEFYTSLNRTLERGTQSRTQIDCPLGNSMKHHIVTLGKKIDAPMHLTWSCYRSGDTTGGKRCGQCGPCLNTSRAFKMAELDLPFEYHCEEIQ
jgi:7-cyano-7-deazaguanine synthase